MALLSDIITTSNTSVVLSVSQDTPGYTDAVRRDHCEDTVVQATKEMILQISLKERPDCESDDDWVEVGTGKYVEYPHAATWMRAKVDGMTEDDRVYIVSVPYVH